MAQTKNKDAANFNLPSVIFGTSGLGNLYVTPTDEEKLKVIRECARLLNGHLVFDSAGKYGAGLALETLGKCLKELNIAPEKVIISNKLGWVRTELKTIEPTFEPGIWRNLKYDAVQKISYDGIIECFEQGNELLKGYIPQMVSVHDPDEYLAAAKDHQHEEKRYGDILDAYKALFELKRQGKVKSVGVGAKNWNIIKRITGDIALDWVMIANSLTIYSHPEDLLLFVNELREKQISIINSAVFNGGFLVGGDYYNYKLVNAETHPALFKWRDSFFKLCEQFSVKPAEACTQFAINVPGINSIALSMTRAERVREIINLVNVRIPTQFWKEMESRNLISVNYREWAGSVS